ncbi:hypothetical protein NL676_034742 [Syzygium grande]|nr:hypothetical protein NL676_034742 [Syzygium grande]
MAGELELADSIPPELTVHGDHLSTSVRKRRSNLRAKCLGLPPGKGTGGEFSARFNPSDQLGFIKEAFEFVAKRSEFLTHVGAERDIATVLRAVREKQKQKLR